MYGFDYKKPTRFWTNIPNLNFNMCNHKGKHKGGQLSGNGSWNGGKLQRYKIPEEVIEKLLEGIKA